jgi:hypothetical protein
MDLNQFGGSIFILINTAIPRDMLPLDMLTPQIRHYELRQKNSRYANFSDLSTPSYAIFDFFQKNSRYANFSDLSTPSYAIFDQPKDSRYANFSAVFTPDYAIVSCVKKFRYADFSPYYLTHKEVACIFVWTQALPVDLIS